MLKFNFNYEIFKSVYFFLFYLIILFFLSHISFKFFEKPNENFVKEKVLTKKTLILINYHYKILNAFLKKTLQEKRADFKQIKLKKLLDFQVLITLYVQS